MPILRPRNVRIGRQRDLLWLGKVPGVLDGYYSNQGRFGVLHFTLKPFFSSPITVQLNALSCRRISKCVGNKGMEIAIIERALEGAMRLDLMYHKWVVKVLLPHVAVAGSQQFPLFVGLLLCSLDYVAGARED